MSRNSVICAPCSGVDAVARLRREVEVRVVAPEVAQRRAVDRVDAANLALVEREHRQQLDGRDPERLEVGDLLDHARRTCPGAATPEVGEAVKPRTCIS